MTAVVFALCIACAATAAAEQQTLLQKLFARQHAQAEAVDAAVRSGEPNAVVNNTLQPAPATVPTAPSRARTPMDGAVDTLPAPMERIHVPITGIGTPGEVRIDPSANGKISLVVRDASLSRVLSIFAQTMNLNIVAANDIDQVVSITLRDVPVEQALSAILAVANYTWVRQHGIIYVTDINSGSLLSADIQGRRIEVFELDFVSAASVTEAVTNFLSPVGTVFSTPTDEADIRRTQEIVVVEDMPGVLSRVAAYIHQVDQPPRQVQIEAHILQVDLTDERRHGVNFEHMFNVAGNAVTLETVGFANAAAPQAFFATVSGGNLTALVELLKTTADVKTLASPKITVLNGQTANIHVGEQLGYRVTTTTETSTLESVDFLDTGVVLNITPIISRDNRVMLRVRPEVSSGQINPDTGVPEEETTELETSVMLENNFGMVIGGLIREIDSVTQSKVPYIGDLWMVGTLFQRSQLIKDRTEIIIVLIPRVLPYCEDYAAFEQGEVGRASTPLFEGPLLRRARPWYPKLPDAVTNPRILRLPPVGKVYPYPAEFLENAGTPQPQNAYIIPPHPLPNFRDTGYGGGWMITPNDAHIGQPLLQDAPWTTGSDTVLDTPIYLPASPAPQSDYTPFDPDASMEGVQPPEPAAP